MKTHLLVFAVLLVNLFPLTAVAQIPNVLSHQGLLTDASGVPLEGSFNLTFSLYQMPTGGTALWTETHTSVPVQNGTFSVRLGSITPFGISFDQQLYLALAIDGGAEMAPRSALSSVPYSLRVGTVDGATGGTIAGNVVITAEARPESLKAKKITLDGGSFGDRRGEE